jgi:hypothetical protein
MIRDFFWLTDDQFSRLELLLPTDTRGEPRVDNRLVNSERRAERYLSCASFHGPPKQVLNDSSAVKPHRCASGGKGGAQSGVWPETSSQPHALPRP